MKPQYYTILSLPQLLHIKSKPVTFDFVNKKTATKRVDTFALMCFANTSDEGLWFELNYVFEFKNDYKMSYAQKEHLN